MVGATALHPSATDGDDSKDHPWGPQSAAESWRNLDMRQYLLSAAATIALMASGAAANDKPATLIDGLGDHHHIIATTQKDAQSYFNQGPRRSARSRARRNWTRRHRCHCGA